MTASNPTSKLHLPGPGAQPLCGRQLDNLRDQRRQDSSRAAIAVTVEYFMLALYPIQEQGKKPVQPHACRWCARAAGLLPPLTRGPRFEGDQEDEL